MSQGERKEILFETSLKSQDDFCIKYKTFKDDDNGDAQNVEKVFPKLNCKNIKLMKRLFATENKFMSLYISFQRLEPLDIQGSIQCFLLEITRLYLSFLIV